MRACLIKCTERPEWAVALFLSVVYFICFVLLNNNILKPGLLFGFCVYGSPQLPDMEAGCQESPVNSHILSFDIDIFMAFLVGVCWKLDRTSPDQKDTTMYVAMAFIILAHGSLHWFLQQDLLNVVIDCYSADVGKDIERVGYTMFGTFSLALGIIILGYGFGLTYTTALGSVGFAVAVLQVTRKTGGELVLPGIFCVSHPLASFTGLYTDAPCFHPRVARWFVLATLVGILELSACSSILQPVGGHLWYDLTLHAAVLASLPYFWSNENVKGGTETSTVIVEEELDSGRPLPGFSSLRSLLEGRVAWESHVSTFRLERQNPKAGQTVVALEPMEMQRLLEPHHHTSMYDDDNNTDPTTNNIVKNNDEVSQRSTLCLAFIDDDDTEQQINRELSTCGTFPSTKKDVVHVRSIKMERDEIILDDLSEADTLVLNKKDEGNCYDNEASLLRNRSSCNLIQDKQYQ